MMQLTVFACPDVMFGLVLVSYWICCHFSLDNCTTDMCSFLYYYTEMTCLSLNLLVWDLLTYPESINSVELSYALTIHAY